MGDCNHNWRYNVGFDQRARRICIHCRKKQVAGHTEKKQWFDSYFAVLLRTDEKHRVTEDEMIASWSDNEIVL